jgi:phosphatidylserine/phosphatidylglycerophosphate/cardiolipin synthase-like enzyme
MPRDVEALITAQQAWPAFERAVLGARQEILAGFRIFDLRTKLRSPEALAVGEDWFDLFAHVLKKGVRIKLVVSDFDPIMATPLHEMAWRTVRQGVALAEVAEPARGQLDIHCALHPAQPGILPWLAFLPAVIPKKWHAKAGMSDARLSREAVGLDDSSFPEMHTASHHQKLAVIDSETLYIGGLDLNERRYDTLTHDRPAPDTWSDVQIMLGGPSARAAARDAREHLLTFESVCAGKSEPTPLPSLKRTISAPRRFQLPFLSPRTVLSEIEEAHLDAFQAARHLIYIETQFLRSSVISDALAEAAEKKPDLSLMVILPSLPEDVAFDGNQGIDARYGLSLQREATTKVARAYGKRAMLAVPVRPVMARSEGSREHKGSPVIHVHNKVLIRDDSYAMVGSANLNGRSMRWDTEVAVEITDPVRVQHIRQRLMAHWWSVPLPEVAQNPETLLSWWGPEIRRNALRLPKNRSGFLVPYDIDNKADMAQPLPGVTENMV